MRCDAMRCDAMRCDAMAMRRDAMRISCGERERCAGRDAYQGANGCERRGLCRRWGRVLVGCTARRAAARPVVACLLFSVVPLYLGKRMVTPAFTQMTLGSPATRTV